MMLDWIRVRMGWAKAREMQDLVSSSVEHNITLLMSYALLGFCYGRCCSHKELPDGTQGSVGSSAWWRHRELRGKAPWQDHGFIGLVIVGGHSMGK